MQSRTLSAAIVRLFQESEKIHVAFIRHSDERDALKHGRDVRTCKRTLIGWNQHASRVRKMS